MGFILKGGQFFYMHSDDSGCGDDNGRGMVGFSYQNTVVLLRVSDLAVLTDNK